MTVSRPTTAVAALPVTTAAMFAARTRNRLMPRARKLRALAEAEHPQCASAAGDAAPREQPSSWWAPRLASHESRHPRRRRRLQARGGDRRAAEAHGRDRRPPDSLAHHDALLHPRL